MSPRRIAAIGAVAVAFLLCAELGVRIASSHLREPSRWSVPEMQWKEAQVKARTARGGYVFFGASGVDTAADPEAIGGRGYNAAIQGASVEMVSVWANKVVLPHLRPDTVVIGLSAHELSPNDLERNQSTRDLLACPAVRELLKDESPLEWADRVAGRFSRLIEYRHVLRAYVDPAKEEDEYDDPLNAPRLDRYGHTQTFVNVVAPYPNLGGAPFSIERFEFAFRNGALRAWTISADKVRAIRRLLADLSAGGTRVVVVNMPVTQDFVRFLPHGPADSARADRVLADLAAATGAEYVAPGVWPTSFFADPIHLNPSGTARFTALMRQVLAS